MKHILPGAGQILDEFEDVLQALRHLTTTDPSHWDLGQVIGVLKGDPHRLDGFLQTMQRYGMRRVLTGMQRFQEDRDWSRTQWGSSWTTSFTSHVGLAPTRTSFDWIITQCTTDQAHQDEVLAWLEAAQQALRSHESMTVQEFVRECERAHAMILGQRPLPRLDAANRTPGGVGRS